MFWFLGLLDRYTYSDWQARESELGAEAQGQRTGVDGTSSSEAAARQRNRGSEGGD